VKIEFSPPDITQREIDEVVDTLKSGWITTGPKTKLFEEKIAEYCNTEKSVAMNSATACMEMVLRILGIGQGDEVITSVYTYSASASVIHHVGAKIVLIDTAKNSFHLDYDALEKAITNKTKAIIAVDIAGVMCDYDKIFEIVHRKKDLFNSTNKIQSIFNRVIIIADAAHSFGSSYKGNISGSIADFTAFSFHAVKNLTTAEGGAVTWRKIHEIDDKNIYKQFKLLILHGQTKDAYSKVGLNSWEYDIVAPNYKFNMTDIMASIGLAQLSRYDEILKRRKQIIESYDSYFEEIDIKPLKHFDKDYISNGHLYLLNLLGKDEDFRNSVIKKMAEKGIATNVHYKPLPMLTAYKDLGFDIKKFPEAYKMYENEITLPLHSLLTDDGVRYVSENLKDVLNEMNYLEEMQVV